jgi:hypothetical protein
MNKFSKKKDDNKKKISIDNNDLKNAYEKIFTLNRDNLSDFQIDIEEKVKVSREYPLRIKSIKDICYAKIRCDKDT